MEAFGMSYEALHEGYYKQQKQINELRLENRELKKRLKAVDEMMVALEEKYYLEVCVPSENYDEEALSIIANGIFTLKQEGDRK